MRTFIPFLVALVKMAAARPESIDFRTGNHMEDMALLFNNLGGTYTQNDIKPLNNLGIIRPHEETDGSNFHHGWREFEPKPRPDAILRKPVALGKVEERRLENQDEHPRSMEDYEDAELSQLTSFLTGLLQGPGAWESPLVLIEEPPMWEDTDVNPDSIDISSRPVWKRSRYYRRYPWKRQNSSYDYDASRYLCTPTREDIFQLLVALHDARQGNRSRTVNFCNRRRPASAIFTNIRFLGRRK